MVKKEKKQKRSLLLVVLDGFGISKKTKGNAIALADTKYITALKEKADFLELSAHGEAVGLVKGYIGNSEVGHVHIGAGRKIEQDLVRINHEIHTKSFFSNKVLCQTMKYVNEHHSSLHLLGLLSDAGVHSHINHLLALIDMAKMQGIKQVFVHAILDGRDTPPKSALAYIKRVEKKLKSVNKNWRIATVMGRYYAMDRDNRWNREHKAYDAIVNCQGLHYENAVSAIHSAYARNETDEFVSPSITGYTCNVRPEDAVIFFNFRSDRARELTRAFVQGRFHNFKRRKVNSLRFVSLTQYDSSINSPSAYPPIPIPNTLGYVLSEHKLRQLRVAETEKWAHVTYFFNGLCECIYPWEDRMLIPSPKVSTYDKIPEMSAYKILTYTLAQIKKKKYSFILVNFANADMVGHTGKLDATIKAIHVLDECIGKLADAAKKNGMDFIITADHGNAEMKYYSNGTINTAHTTNKVPFIYIGHKTEKLKTKGTLANIAPTVLDILGIKKPKEMTKSLFEK